MKRNQTLSEIAKQRQKDLQKEGRCQPQNRENLYREIGKQCFNIN